MNVTLAAWTPAAVRRQAAHFLCCTPESGPCALARATRPPNAAAGTGDWAPWQLGAHARADFTDALDLLYAWQPDPSWWDRPDRRFRTLPEQAAGLWVAIARGPTDDRLLDTPRGWFPTTWAGTLRWRDAERLLHRHSADIKAAITDAVEHIASVLSPETPAASPYEPGLVCRPGAHAWGVGGVPHPEALCRCGRMTWQSAHTA